LSGKGYDHDPARMTVIYPTPALPKWNSGSGEVWIHRVAVGSGLRATVDMARPTKEDKIRRKAKPQRQSDKKRAGGDRRDHDGIGRLTDARKSQKKTSANRLPESNERLPRAGSRKKCGVAEECSNRTMTEIDPVHHKAKRRGSIANVFMFKPSES
jgi:hypothetical protein